ncbi:MAG: hypothetical protein ACLFU8_10865 [Anaerolineales bacterium]
MQINQKAVEHAKELIKEGKYVVDTDWSEAQPEESKGNALIDEQGWNAYGKWFLAVNEDEPQDEKERYNFPYGDFEKVHRSGLIAAQQRAGQYDHDEVEKVADELTAMIDERAGE